ncbi:MORN repeat-containing protein 5 [Apostichopus japonicus]|uniref:MORN repeat-containing protein 5 n=1 Tax=Stichopus japonicus TaxID=307972 RepID=A0A2G8LKQ0_STIJA|nr:MORN repeat-containing protein 5 [Apostichopus japonicus]
MEYTGSSYSGDFKNGRMEGSGKYTFPTETKYEGDMKMECSMARELSSFQMAGKYTFADGLEYNEEDWLYCDGYDRRFYTEICQGLKPAELIYSKGWEWKVRSLSKGDHSGQSEIFPIS